MTQQGTPAASLTLSIEHWFDIRHVLKQAGLPHDVELAEEILRQLIDAGLVS